MNCLGYYDHRNFYCCSCCCYYSYLYYYTLGAGEVLETKKVAADINPVWNDNFAIHNIGIDDVVEFTVKDYGVLAQSHVGGLWANEGGQMHLEGRGVGV